MKNVCGMSRVTKCPVLRICGMSQVTKRPVLRICGMSRVTKCPVQDESCFLNYFQAVSFYLLLRDSFLKWIELHFNYLLLMSSIIWYWRNETKFYNFGVASIRSCLNATSGGGWMIFIFYCSYLFYYFANWISLYFFNTL